MPRRRPQAGAPAITAPQRIPTQTAVTLIHGLLGGKSGQRAGKQRVRTALRDAERSSKNPLNRGADGRFDRDELMTWAGARWPELRERRVVPAPAIVRANTAGAAFTAHRAAIAVMPTDLSGMQSAYMALLAEFQRQDEELEALRERDLEHSERAARISERNRLNARKRAIACKESR